MRRSDKRSGRSRRDPRRFVASRSRRVRPVTSAAAAAIALVVVMLFIAPYARRSGESGHATKTPPSFVGSNVCASCHAREAADWTRSQHRAAMTVANDTTVLGNFHGATLMYAGVRTE